MDEFERQPSFSRRQWQLLDAAVRLLDRAGISGFTMRSLADETGLSPMAAYKHFENQRALQLELWRFCENHLYDTLLEAAQPADDPAGAFLRILEAFARYAQRYPYRFELLHNHPFVREAHQVEVLQELRMNIWEYAYELVERAQSAGLFRNDKPTNLLLAAAVAQVRGLASLLVYIADTSPIASVPQDDLIASSVGFIRDAMLAR